MRKALLILTLAWLLLPCSAFGSGCIKWVSVEDHGANGSDGNDDTTGIQTALDTGCNVYFPKGKYYIADTTTSKLRCSTVGQMISGSSDRNESAMLCIDTSFKNSTEAGVFVIDGLNPGPVFSNLMVRFMQLDCVIPDLEQDNPLQCSDEYGYPPLFYINNSPGTRISNLLCTRAYHVAEVFGDSDNVSFNLIRFSSMSNGIYIGAATGKINISNTDSWSFELQTQTVPAIAGKQSATLSHDYYRNSRCGAAIKIESGATVCIDNVFSSKGCALDIGGDGVNVPTVFCTNFLNESLTYPLIMRDGYLHISNSSLNTANYEWSVEYPKVPERVFLEEEVDEVMVPRAPISLLGGHIVMSNTDFIMAWEPPLREPVVQYPGNVQIASGVTLQMSGCQFYNSMAEATQHAVIVKNGGIIMVNGNIFWGPVSSSGDRLGDLFQVEDGGVISMSGCAAATKSTIGIRALLELQGNNKHNIYANSWCDWRYDAPPSTSNMVFAHNADYDVTP